MTNMFKTAVLLALLTAMLVLIGGAIGGQQGMAIAFVLALGMNFFSYWYSDKMVLAMYQAQPVDERSAPQLYAMVRRLATRAQLPMPRLYIVPGDTPNAFATGRNPEHAVVAVTEGILRVLDEDELEGVLAHELSHVKNRDVLVSTVAATLAGAITYLAHMAQWSAMFGGRHHDEEEGGTSPIAAIAMAIVAPIAAMLVQMAVSRSREFGADATGAQISGNPSGLARALQKLQLAQEALPMAANPATAHLFIVNPLSGRALANLFSTHPPLEERIARLRAMERTGISR
ncbi:MAG TPA: zinc metalloprotease HtpX [Terriglobales bacterium]|nr:zinc metalloprotease HtpX [Terriglobales bacterium]